MEFVWKLMIEMLSKPGSLHIAERMVNSNRSGREVLPRSNGRSTCWWCQLKATESPAVFRAMHWSRILLYLAAQEASSSKDTFTIRPRFCVLPSLVQKNLLVLVSRHINSVGSPVAVEFLNALKDAYQKDDWVHFLSLKLLRLLEERVVNYQKSESNANMSDNTISTALTSACVKRINELGRQFSALHLQSSGVKYAISTVDSDLITDMTAKNPKLTVPSIPLLSQDTQDVLIGKKRKRIEDELLEDELKIPAKHPHVSLLSGSVVESVLSAPVIQISATELEKGSKLRESWLKAEVVDKNEFSNVLELDSVQLCSVMEISPSLLSEDVVLAVFKNVIEASSDICIANLVAISELWITPWLRVRAECLSRAFTGAVVAVLSHHFTVVLDGIVIPLLKDSDIGTVQADFVCKLIREDLTVEQSTIVFRKFIRIEENTKHEPYVWNETIVTVAHSFLGKAVNIESCDTDSLLKVLQRSSHNLCTSVKFGMFVKNFISGYSHVLQSHGPMMLDIANSHKSSVKGLLTKCVAKLTN